MTRTQIDRREVFAGRPPNLGASRFRESGAAPRGAAAGLAALLALASLPGCVTPPPPEPEVLVAASGLRAFPDYLARQRVSGEFRGHRETFEAALQKRGDTLTVIGLTPFGTKAFVLEQSPGGVAFTSHLPPDRSLPLKPRYLLQDIHHAFFAALPGPPPAAESAVFVKGARARKRGKIGGELLDEVWDPRGRAVEARFFRGRVGDVGVTYEPGMEGGLPPARARVENERYGYTLEIETLSVQRLE